METAMKIKRLKKLIENIDDDVELVINHFDHTYRKVHGYLSSAIRYDFDDLLHEDYEHELTNEETRVNVLILC